MTLATTGKKTLAIDTRPRITGTNKYRPAMTGTTVYEPHWGLSWESPPD